MKPLSPAAVAVLRAVAAGTTHGFDIVDETGLASGTVYPILARFEKAGLVRARWEAASIARREKRPPRRYYEISAAGSRELAQAIDYYRALASATSAPRPARA